MIRNTGFWIALALFEVAFGVAVFAVTRQYYLQAPDNVPPQASTVNQSDPAWPDELSVSDIARLDTAVTGGSLINDPVEISRQADEFFANSEYERAAELYERLLSFNPNNVNVLNNLGLTLAYLDNPTESLQRLNEGIALDPTNQRIWLTLGYVNSRFGDSDAARKALTTASQIGDDESIRQSALEMLEGLP